MPAALLLAIMCVVSSARVLAQNQDLPVFTAEDVAKNGYVVYEGQVLDVSRFRHPGGASRLQRYVGKDATEVLNRKHSSRDRSQLGPLVIGVLA